MSGSGFANYLVTKTGYLVRTFIQSPGFVHLVRGWSINKDGSAEFNDVTIRGGLIENGPALYYSTNPGAANKLIASVSDTEFKDAYGNWVLDGVTSYGPDAIDGSGYIAQQTVDGIITWYHAAVMTGVTPPWSVRSVVTWSISTGLLIQNPAGNVELEGIGGTVSIPGTLTVAGTAWSQAAVPAAYPAGGSPSNAGLATYSNQIVQALQAAGLMA